VADIVMVRLPGGAGRLARLGPGLVAAELPGVFPSHLVVGLSSRVDRYAAGWEMLIEPGDADFEGSGLAVASVIRPSWIISLPASEEIRVIGWVDPARVQAVQSQIGNHLLSAANQTPVRG
jgi:mRNA interferase MazF